MKIVLDTNVLLMALPRQSKFRPIFDALLNGDFELLLSNEILSEYTEIIANKTNAEIAQNVAELLLNLKNVKRAEVFFRWGLISSDYDDNKFVDCAIAGNASFLVSNDNHFKQLKNIDFPKVQVLSAEKFLAELI